MQRRGRDEIAAMQHRLRATRLGVSDRRREMAAVIVGVGDDADFHRAGIVPNLQRQAIQ